MNFRILQFVLSVTAVAAVVIAIPTGGITQDSSQPLVIEHADSTEVYRSGDQTEYQLYGDVRFSQGDTRLRGNRAIWRQEEGVITLDGQVEVQQPQRWVTAQSIRYESLRRRVDAFGDVRVEDTSQGFSLYSQRAHFDRTRDLAIADSFPSVVWDFLLDSASRTYVDADTIIYDRPARSGYGVGHVVVHKGDWLAKGDRGTIWPDSSRAIMTGSPSAEGIGGNITGDTLILEFTGRGVRQVRALGHASGVYRDTSSSDPGTNILRGQIADFFIENDSLRAIRMIGQAYADYQPADTTEGSNHASGDSLWMRFEQGRLETVTIAGGAQGRYQSPPTDGSADTIDYHADTIVFFPDSNRVDLEGSGELRYGTTVLTAGLVSYWSDKRSLLARGFRPDDTSGLVQRPILSDGTQTITGDQLTYNIDSRRGRIRGSSTEFEGAYYRGGDFRKYTDSVYFVNEGIYTTCDLEEPHFRFESKDMEIIRNDKVIARPVTMRIGELPVAMLPYYIFPIKRGRHSGFLPLRFGNFTQGERFIGNAGYYWAASDYWDIVGALDYNEESGTLIYRGGVNYAWRYHFTGNVAGSYTRTSRIGGITQSQSTRWSLTGTHQQTLTPTASLSGSMNFLSDASYYQDYSFDPVDRRQRTLKSQANFSKRWKSASLTAFVQNTENLDTESKTRQLPELSFQMNQRRILSPDSGQESRWYHNAYVSYSSNFRHFQNLTPTSGDTTGRVDERRYATAQHSSAISFPQKVLHYISVSPNASLQEAWYYVFDTRLARDQGVPVEDPGRRLSGSAGVSANTNLYGFLNPRLWGLNTIRHTMTPRISYSFTPAIVQNDELRSYTGAGGGSPRRSQLLSFGLSNVFDAKIHEGDKEKKITLLNLGLSTRYDIEALSRNWGLLSADARTNISRLDLQVDATWDLYNQQTFDLQWTNPTLTNIGISAGTSLKGGVSPLSTVTAIGEGYDQRDTARPAEEIPFNLSLSYRYTESRSLGRIGKDHWTGWRVDIKPTKNWSVNYQQTYNWSSHTITDQRFEVTRDLHCWEARFHWVPTGSGQGYYFRIGIKAIPDIKLERSESGLLGTFGRGY